MSGPIRHGFVSACLLGLGIFLSPVADSAERAVLAGFLGRIKAKRINESSGICPSRKHDGVFWTHNDSGDGPRLFAIRLDGSLVATVTVKGAKARDWEDIAIDTDGVIHIADVGNNKHNRKDLRVYRVHEPERIEGSPTVRVAETLPVTFEQQADCEAIFIDEKGRPNLITKTPVPGSIYRWNGESWSKTQSLPTQDMVTGAALSEDGVLAVSSYLGYVLFQRDAEGLWREKHRSYAILEQCEAVCWYKGGLLLTSEQRALFRFTPN